MAILFQIILKKESPDDLPVTFQGSFFTEEELAPSTPIEVLVDGLETALHMHLYEDEDPTLLKNNYWRQLDNWSMYIGKEEKNLIYIQPCL